jgi:hypothetical protein
LREKWKELGLDNYNYGLSDVLKNHLTADYFNLIL